MIARPVVVVGPLRGGCSLVTGICHRLGFHAGLTFIAPHPPTWRLDYQEVELSVRLVERRWPTLDWWHLYIEKRRALSQRVGFGGRVVLNCQWLALCWDALIEALEAEWEHPLTIRTYRDGEGLARSMAAHPLLKQADQDEIVAALYRRVSPEFEISYDFLVDDPEQVVRILAERLGVEDAEAVKAAVAMVGKPTEYPVQERS